MPRNITMINDERGLELPINIVVMLVVGMVALAALIAIIPTPTKTMSVSVDPSMIAATSSDFTSDVEGVVVTVTDPDGNPVQGATCILRGAGGVASATSGNDGACNLKKIGDGTFNLPSNQNELNLKLTVKADGFYDYENENAVLVVKTF